MEGRPYENNLKLLLIRRMGPNGLTLEQAMVAYSWFDYYYLLNGGDGRNAYELTRSRVMQAEGLHEKPPVASSVSTVESIKRRLRDWLS